MFFQFRACWKSLKNFGNISDPLIFVNGVYKIGMRLIRVMKNVNKYFCTAKIRCDVRVVCYY